MEYYLAIKKNEILPYATTWMDLEGIMLSEKKLDRERQILYNFTYMWNLKKQNRDFPGGPVVKTPFFHCRRHGFDPCQGTKIPHATQCSQKNKK